MVTIERWNRAGVANKGDALLELRVTQTFRREDGSWRFVHRHADPFVQKREPP